jgi:hypothetical protein
MRQGWQYQLRIYLNPDLAETARSDKASPRLRALTTVLEAHGAALVSQLDAFEAYLQEAERGGIDRFPLYRWTKATLEDPEKRAKHSQAFALRVRGAEVYGPEAADALEADLRLLVGGDVVLRLSRHDTNPDHNLPVPDQYRS